MLSGNSAGSDIAKLDPIQNFAINVTLSYYRYYRPLARPGYWSYSAATRRETAGSAVCTRDLQVLPQFRRPAGPPATGRFYSGDETMPSLLRILFVIGIIAGVGYGSVFALAYLVKPKPREISVTLPADRFYKAR
jgi:hypothetical protein